METSDAFYGIKQGNWDIWGSFVNWDIHVVTIPKDRYEIIP